MNRSLRTYLTASTRCFIGMLCILSLSFFVGCSKKGNQIQRLSPDQPIRVEARLDRAVAAVGDKIIFTVQAVARKGVDVLLPFDLETPPGLEIRDSQTPKVKNIGSDQMVHRREWALSPSKVGAYILEPMEVSYDSKKVKTPKVYLDVRSVLKEGDLEGDIRDIKGPVPLPSSFWIILGIAGASAALIVLALLGYRYWKTRAPALPPLLPHEWALKELEALLVSGLMESGKYKEFTERLSWIFRSYVEKRFGLMAPERTTEEFIAEMRNRQEFGREQQGLVGRLLAFCDMIKFAKYAPVVSEMSQGVKVVRDFIHETKPAPPIARDKSTLTLPSPRGRWGKA